MKTIKIEINVDDLIPDDGFEPEMEFACPVATEDAKVNDANRQSAMENYAYGPATETWENKNARCGTCEYFDIRSKMISCMVAGIGYNEGMGYCSELNFVCDKENVCNLWDLGVPVIDGMDSEMNPDDDGNQRDIL
jgi:hypothetical protein